MTDEISERQQAADYSGDASVLAGLSGDKDRYVRLAVARNRNTPAEALAKLAADRSYRIREAAARNGNTPAGTLGRLSQDREPIVRLAAAGNRGTPPEALVKMVSDDPEPAIRGFASENPSTPVQVLVKAFKEAAAGGDRSMAGVIAVNILGREGVLETILSMAKIPEEKTVRASAPDIQEDSRFLSAKSADTVPDVLAELARDGDWHVRAAVAANANTPAEVLARLAEDEVRGVLAEVAWNRNTPLETLSALSSHECPVLRSVVARNGRTPAHALARLSFDEDENVRIGVARNPHAPAPTLGMLSRDGCPSVRAAAASNPNTPAEVLSSLARDESREVREAAAGNANTPAEAVVLLSKDADVRVQEMARGNPRGREDRFLSADGAAVKVMKEFARDQGAREGKEAGYGRYVLPEGVKEDAVRIGKHADGKWKVSVDLGDAGRTSVHDLSPADCAAYFRDKTATKGQIAAKHLGAEMKSLLAAPTVEQENTKGMRRRASRGAATKGR